LRNDGLIRCIDGKCGCLSDDDCKDASGKYRYDPVRHTKIVCDSPSGSYPHDPTQPYTYACKPKPSCSVAEDCADGWCCYTPEIGGDRTCQQQGTIKSYQGKSYLCDPPEEFDSSAKKLSLLDFLANPFSKVFS